MNRRSARIIALLLAEDWLGAMTDPGHIEDVLCGALYEAGSEPAPVKEAQALAGPQPDYALIAQEIEALCAKLREIISDLGGPITIVAVSATMAGLLRGPGGE